MKRNSYKKGPRFGPDACGYLEDIVQQPITVPVEPVIVEPVKVEPVVSVEKVEVAPEVVVEPVEEVEPVAKPVATTVDTKSFDKKKK